MKTSLETYCSTFSEIINLSIWGSYFPQNLSSTLLKNSITEDIVRNLNSEEQFQWHTKQVLK